MSDDKCVVGRTVEQQNVSQGLKCSSSSTAISEGGAIIITPRLQERVGPHENRNTKKIWEPFTKHMAEIGLVQLTGACQLPVNDKLMSPLPFSL